MFLINEVNYLSLESLFDTTSIKSLAFFDSHTSSQVMFFKEREIIDKIMEIINVSYVNRDYFEDISWISKGGDCYEAYRFTTGMGYEIDYNNIISFCVYGNGNVSIDLIKNGVRTKYLSIVKVDFEALKVLCGYKKNKEAN